MRLFPGAVSHGDVRRAWQLEEAPLGFAGRWVSRLPGPCCLAPRWSCIWKLPIRYFAVSWSSAFETFFNLIYQQQENVAHLDFPSGKNFVKVQWQPQEKTVQVFSFWESCLRRESEMRDVQDIFWKLKKNSYCIKIYVIWKKLIMENWKQLNIQQLGIWFIHVLEYNTPFENTFKELLITENFSWHNDRCRKPVPRPPIRPSNFRHVRWNKIKGVTT